MKKQRWRARDYVVIPRSILTLKISPSALRLWIALASFCYDTDECWPSNNALLERMPTGTALNTVKAAKRELEEVELIRRERRFIDGRETSSIYYLLAPEGTVIQPNHEGNQTITHEGNEVVPRNKTILNKNNLRVIKGDKDTFSDLGYKGKQKKTQSNISSIPKRTKDGYVYDKEAGVWVEES
tara:strand:+ start:831 stop:1382 length:552 start_codon:yes stop_codon:yes gene_type:complete